MDVKKGKLIVAWRVIKNPYVATLIIFALLMCFAENNIFVTFSLRRELSQLKREERQLREEMEHDRAHFEVLKGDIKANERYGREVYYLRRPNEDVYIFER